MPFIAAVWGASWKRGAPADSTLAAWSHKLHCAGPANRHAMKHRWRAAGAAYFKHRKAMLWRREVEPYYGCTVAGCDHWAIPVWSTNCESGGGARGDNIYGNLSATYHGGSKWEQSLSAYYLWQEYGGSYGAYEDIWLQWETGCTGWPGP